MLDHLSFHHNTTIHHKTWKNGFSTYIQAFTDRESNFYNQIVVQTRFQVKMIVVMAALMAMWPKQHKTQNAKCKKMYQKHKETQVICWPLHILTFDQIPLPKTKAQKNRKRNKRRTRKHKEMQKREQKDTENMGSL